MHHAQMGERDGGSPRQDDIKIKKTRASKPKVKTGCQTCKIRRVKCDETKPSCLRCVRFGHQCDGYTNKSPTKSGTTSSKSSRVLVPKSPGPGSPLSPSPPSTKSPSSDFRHSPITSTNPKLYPSPTRLLFQSPHEYQAFQNFCSRTSMQLSSTDLWTRLMLQACETSPSIRHAVIAIGSLNLSPPSPRPENSVGTLRHQFAFRQYSKALCLLRRDVAGSFCDLRTTLIACLLFYCFESYHGYHEPAISQVYSGLKLIREWASSTFSSSPSSPSSLNNFANSCGEDAQTMEEDIHRAFSTLEIQIMTYADTRTREAHSHYRHKNQSVIDSMPSIFPSLLAAKASLEVVIRRSMHWLRSTMHLQNFSTPSSPSSSPISTTSSTTTTTTTTSSSPSSPSQTPSPSTLGSETLFFDIDPPFPERHTTLSEYSTWDTAFRPLLNHSRSKNAPHEEFLAASTLRLFWLAGYMCVASAGGGCSRSALVNDGRFGVEMEEGVGIAGILLANGNSQVSGAQAKGERERGAVKREDGGDAKWEFDMQIIVPLMTVGWIYRHRALRQQAISLLLRSPRKEGGVWDGVVIGKIMAWLSEIEEESIGDDEDGREESWGRGRGDRMDGVKGGKGDYVPEWAAARCIQMGFDSVRREASVSCLQPVRGSLVGEEVRREVVIPW